MKKIIVILFILSIIIINNSKDEVLIPDNSIRYRIIANSNTVEDQRKKIEIKEQINKEIMPILSNSNSIDKARELIKENIPQIEKIVSSYTDDFKINYGNNFFPQKIYKGIAYDEGNYESLVITLGSGLGENWWCVLYPPLCLVDDTKSDIEYTSLIKEILNY